MQFVKPFLGLEAINSIASTAGQPWPPSFRLTDESASVIRRRIADMFSDRRALTSQAMSMRLSGLGEALLIETRPVTDEGRWNDTLLGAMRVASLEEPVFWLYQEFAEAHVLQWKHASTGLSMVLRTRPSLTP